MITKIRITDVDGEQQYSGTKDIAAALLMIEKACRKGHKVTLYGQAFETLMKRKRAAQAEARKAKLAVKESA